MGKFTWFLRQAFTAVSVTLFLFTLPTGLQVSQAAPQERTFKVYEPNLPKNVIEIKQVNNLQSSSFPQGFEVEVKNISNKPIYYMDFGVVLPESGAPPFWFHVRYGRPEIANFKLVGEEDVPLLPGKSVVLVADTSLRQDLLPRFKDNDAEWARATSRTELLFQSLHFGDGTGYTMDQPYPAIK